MQTNVAALSEYEIERGKPIPSKLHAFVQLRIGYLMMKNYEKQFSVFSELLLELPLGTIIPDVAIYPPMVIDFFHDEIKMSEPPLCAIEILSPTQAIQELIERAPKYFNGGVRSFWVVVPPFKTIYVFSDAETYETFTDQAILWDKKIGIELSLAEIFLVA